jgi:renalase
VAKTVIVGAGLCGVWLACQLNETRKREVLVLEKSRGVGGRLATRRTESAKFDHGAQFYSAKTRLSLLHERWLAAGLVQPYFDADGVTRMMSPTGMTALAKSLAYGVEVKLEHLVEKIVQTETGWRIECAGERAFSADEVVLTCPLPQALELLDRSGLPYDSSLKQIQYAPALVGLFEGVTHGRPSSYDEPTESHIFSIADQYAKGLSKVPAFSVTMKPAFSEEFFSDQECEVVELIGNELKALDPKFTFSSGTLKRWRYSHPLSVSRKTENLYAQPSANLFVCGDAFGGPSLAGAAASAESCYRALTRDPHELMRRPDEEKFEF